MYNIKFEKRVKKDLKGVPREKLQKIIVEIENLTNNPYPPSSTKLKGRDAWRIRIGDYRVIYTVNNNELLILVVKIGHRKDVYK